MPPDAPVILRAQLRPRAAVARAQRTGRTKGHPSHRPAYVARLLALGHQLRQLLDEGRVESVGELARRLEVSQPRVTQVLNLTYLSPAIQAEVAALEAVDGKEPLSERPLREVLQETGWAGQWRVWREHRPRRTQRSTLSAG